jgi:large subunit ribosomal protein L5
MAATATMPRLREKYTTEVCAELMKRFGIKNIHAAPRPMKLVVSMGVGLARENKSLLDEAAADLTTLSGQKAALRKAKVSVANFKLREDMPIGCMVTLRGNRMWEFLDRLISVAMPRIKDFRGLKRGGFDGRGNYSVGLQDQTVFPEIDLDKLKNYQGMNITVVTSAPNDEIGFALLESLGMPFRKPEEDKK